jgi:hypothetical protein
MTFFEAKAITIKVWSYLRDNPHIEYKTDLPDCIYNLIRNRKYQCALCEVFGDCVGCPLNDGSNCFDDNSLYHEWSSARSDNERKNAAAKIVDRVLASPMQTLDILPSYKPA